MQNSPLVWLTDNQNLQVIFLKTFTVFIYFYFKGWNFGLVNFGSKVIFYFRPGLHFWESNLTATISSENVILQYYTTKTVTLFHFHQKFKNEITVKALLQGYFDLFQIPNTIKILNLTQFPHNKITHFLRYETVTPW